MCRRVHKNFCIRSKLKNIQTHSGTLGSIAQKSGFFHQRKKPLVFFSCHYLNPFITVRNIEIPVKNDMSAKVNPTKKPKSFLETKTERPTSQQKTTKKNTPTENRKDVVILFIKHFLLDNLHLLLIKSL